MRGSIAIASAGAALLVCAGGSLAASDVLRIDGVDGHDRLGAAIAPAGDVDGDGRQDIIIGAPGVDAEGRDAAGSAYVVYGGATTGSRDAGALGEEGFKILGADPGQAAGTSVGGAGDVNGDGLDDVIVGAPGVNDGASGSSVGRGRAYVVFGKRDALTIDLRFLGDQGFRIFGRRYQYPDFFGTSVAGAGDVDRDGLDDVVVGAPGNPGAKDVSTRGGAYVVYGSKQSRSVVVRKLGARGFRIAPRTGVPAVAGAGDLNADRRGDVLVGDLNAGHGRAYVIFGRHRRGSVSLQRLRGRGFLIHAPRSYLIGAALDGAGDVDQDGRDDVIVGTPGRGAFVIHGSRSDATVELGRLRGRGYRIAGARAGDSVAGLGFVNEGRRADAGLIQNGSPVVVFGSRDESTVFLSKLGEHGFARDGHAIDPAGLTLIAAAGDWDGDQRGDVLAANPLADNGGDNTGSAFVLLTRL